MSAQYNNQKQPYHQPQVKIYGDIKNLTLSVAIEGNIDGAGQDAVPNKTD
ncbi:hypothetical protein IQ249_20185 [Lusitaniella coriacea LEGE 07157]|uniref:Uncharacterized protein n=1 Tax=Lusitaniella coriacea LEGE 07157 TaxID=945747 RepID=A0A8J7IV74_9CYAN|nr:hypothetical protein [Lusitaniella coriacea]MBE9118217.1 hypothetical protein [Lusitaniella coriacea LEGE 07157]